jgi:hypothetical protein
LPSLLAAAHQVPGLFKFSVNCDWLQLNSLALTATCFFLMSRFSGHACDFTLQLPLEGAAAKQQQ